MSEADNALSKPCPVCERAKILKSMDVCLSCGIAADEETQRDIDAIERFAGKHRAFDVYCVDHGIDPHD